MKPWFLRNLIITGLIMLLGSASALWAGQTGMRISDLKSEDRNGDYLSEFKAPPKETTMQEYFFNKVISDEMQSKYKSFDDSYEFKKEYHLDRMEDYYRYQSANKDLADWTMRKMAQYHVENSIKNAPKDSDTAKTAQAIVNTTQAIRNTTLDINDSTKAKFKYDLPSGKATMGLSSDYVNSSVEYSARPVNPAVGQINTSDRLNVTMNRDLKPFDASTNMHYGVMTQSLNYGVTKHLYGPFSADVGQKRNLAGQGTDETVYRINFGTKF